MQELINHLTEKVGITAEQATKSIEAVKDYVKEKFPMMAGAVDNLFAGKTEAAAPADAPKAEGGNVMDKISDVIPGETGEKVEEFAKNAAQKAEDVFGDVKSKLSGLFGGDNK